MFSLEELTLLIENTEFALLSIDTEFSGPNEMLLIKLKTLLVSQTSDLQTIK